MVLVLHCASACALCTQPSKPNCKLQTPGQYAYMRASIPVVCFVRIVELCAAHTRVPYSLPIGIRAVRGIIKGKAPIKIHTHNDIGGNGESVVHSGFWFCSRVPSCGTQDSPMGTRGLMKRRSTWPLWRLTITRTHRLRPEAGAWPWPPGAVAQCQQCLQLS